MKLVSNRRLTELVLQLQAYSKLILCSNTPEEYSKYCVIIAALTAAIIDLNSEENIVVLFPPEPTTEIFLAK